MFPRWVGLAVVLVATATRALAVGATLVGDTHVNLARPDANSGAISNLNVGAGYTTLVQFDLGSLPSGTTAAQISRAVLRLYCNRADTPGPVTLQAVNSAWGEYSVTFASLPAIATASQTFTVSREGVFLSIDVTALVQGWITTPSSNNGIALASNVAAVQFDSKENDLTGHAPALDVVLVSQGPMGPKGDSGAVGVQGVPGPIGPQGIAGPAGAQGVQGLAGPIGSTGPIGPAGPIGATGLQGPKGEPGSDGLTGPQGPAGSPGLVYRGPYTPTTAYARGDVVLSGGTSFISLADGNYGTAPESGAPWWQVLAAEGGAGPQGPAGVQGSSGVMGPVGPPGVAGMQGLPGAQGATGPQGSTGMTGATGPQGPIGLQGLAGPPGATGANGPAGPQGPQGAAGPVGMTFRGTFSASTTYAAGDGVSYDGAGYVSLVSSNLGNAPDESPAMWGKFAAGSQGPVGATGTQGPIGLQGPAGPSGAMGAIGPAGPQGLQGPAGAVGMSFRGVFSPSTNYVAGDGVSYDGAGYVSLVSSNLGNVPDQFPAVWGKFAAGTQGPAGPQGAQGPSGSPGAIGSTGLTGATGPVGPQGPVGVQGPAGPAGTPGTTGATGPAGPQGLQGITGAAGPAGARGPQGPAGVSFKGAWSSETGYLANDAVSYDGSTYLALQTSLGARPDTVPAAWALLAQGGSAGATGPAGMAATVSIGTVTTTAPGTPATVTNSGNAAAAVFNFSIPQGAAGAGGGGGSGSGWSSFGSMYHSVSFNTNFYSVSNPNANVAENETVLTWVPLGCTATTLAVYSQQANTIKVTMRLGSPTAMADTELSCSVSTGSSCTSTGSVNVPAGSFVDLQIASANGKAAGVWTAVACN